MEITLENGLIMENGVVKSGKNCEGDIVLPEDAKAIAPKAFYNNKKITSLTLPEGLTSIRRLCRIRLQKSDLHAHTGQRYRHRRSRLDEKV